MSKPSTQLRELARRLMAIADSLDAESEEGQPPKPPRKRVAAPAPSVEELRAAGRESAEQILQAQSKKNVEAIFREVGGSAADAKRPMHELVQRVLHRVFDFDAGQNLLRGSSGRADRPE